ncbi:VCBS repeat-containing protein [Haliangium sp. UPWRP_2]|uniref:FG-GAP repeat domain-containing protein n=1 Tax=Haliangium sp. UPWRP_2 TaxID=1931276 RepID=UPI000B53BA57|nr:VCBS repeat-containing protein [Haliangium sp. UPWRP_2]PSM31700.1 VCBS repeat-containing protein [Haliangium sp. UPWRP_2]
MHKGLALLFSIFLLTCSGSDITACDGKDGICLALAVEGTVSGLDQLAVTLDQPAAKTLKTPTPPQAFSLPVQLALLLSAQPSGTLKVSVDGMTAGQVVAHGEATVLPPLLSGTLVRVTLTSSNGPTDLTLSGTDPVNAAELDPLRISLSATDPKGLPVAVTVQGLPNGAMFVPQGNGGDLTWTPGFADAGTYMVTVTAKSSDMMRTVVKTLTITVANYADPLFDPTTLAPLAAIPVGDFDGDGFGDLAVCAGPALGGTSNYSIRIIYGDASGLPTQGPFPPARTKVYSPAVPSGMTAGGEYNCAAGDFDGDGRSDIFLSDPFNSNRTKTQNGLLLVLYGVPRVIDVLPVLQLLDPAPNSSQNLARYPIVGDYNGDKLADVIGVTRQGNDTYVLWLGQKSRSTMPSTTAYSPTVGTWCAMPAVPQAFGDVNGDGFDDILLQEPNVGLPMAMTCTGTVANDYGGMRILTGRAASSAPDLSQSWDYRHPANPVGMSPFRYDWSQLSTLCDVNGDGRADLVAVDTALRVWLGNASGLMATSPLDVSQMNPIAPQSGKYAQPICAREFFGPKTVVVANPTAAMGGRLEVLSGGPLVVSRTLPNPDPADTGFGSTLVKQTADINGDGKQDLVAYGANKRWVIYGR